MSLSGCRFSCIHALRLGVSAVNTKGMMTWGAVDGMSHDSPHYPENESEDNRKNEGGDGETMAENPNDVGDERCSVRNWSAEADAMVDTEIMLSAMETEGNLTSDAAGGVTCEDFDMDHE